MAALASTPCLALATEQKRPLYRAKTRQHHEVSRDLTWAGEAAPAQKGFRS